MNGDEDTAQRYRQRAEELRVIADGLRGTVSYKVLLTMADVWEHMAESRERIAQSDRTRRRK